MRTDDTSYYRRRAEEELAAAEQSNDAGTAEIHREMAKLYRERVAVLESEGGTVVQLWPEGPDRIVLAHG